MTWERGPYSSDRRKMHFDTRRVGSEIQRKKEDTDNEKNRRTRREKMLYEKEMRADDDVLIPRHTKTADLTRKK
jgi:hypothetical protein